MLVVVHFLTSNVHRSTAVVCTFPFFDAWFNIVCAVFSFSFPFGVSSPPNSQVRGSLFVVIPDMSITKIDLFSLVMELC